jgi:hypothetical protein
LHLNKCNAEIFALQPALKVLPKNSNINLGAVWLNDLLIAK